MASSDVDQKYLARLAELTAHTSPLLSSSLFQILGLSVMLSRRLIRARTRRRLDTTRDTKSLQLYHHIIWLSREGLAILETFVLPYTREGQQGRELQIMAVKLQASFFHVFCLFHNNPPVSQTNISTATIPSAPASLSPRADSRQTRRDRVPPDSDTGVSGKSLGLRDPIPSYTSDMSYLTNPYASPRPGIPTLSPSSPSRTRRSPAVPPGLIPIPPPAQSGSFIFPVQNFVPAATAYFDHATSLATHYLPGSHPLRLSVAVEHAAFLWDCIKDGDGSRVMARRAIRECHRSNADLSDADFDDAAECVGVLGRMMRREGLGRSPGTARTRSTAGSSTSARSPQEARQDVSARGVTLAEPSTKAAMRGGYTQSTTSPTSTRSSAGRGRGRGGGDGGDLSQTHQKPASARVVRGKSDGSGSATQLPSGDSGTTKTPRARNSGQNIKNSGTSAQSADSDTRRDGHGSKASSSRTSALRGSGVTRGGPSPRSRAGTSTRGGR